MLSEAISHFVNCVQENLQTIVASIPLGLA
jgi:hypothetical protein